MDQRHDPDGPSGPQNWEDCVDQVGDRFARHGDLEELLVALDARYERDAADAVRMCGRLNDLCAGDLRAAFFGADWHVDRAIIGVLAMACWNHARRLGGEPDMVEGVRSAPDGSRPPFGSVAAAWNFAVETAHLALGSGPLGSVVAETSEMARAMGRAIERAGRDRGADGRGVARGGFLPVEWMASSPTHVGGASAKNESAIALREDVRAAIDKALSPGEALLLERVIVGEPQRVPRARVQGDRFRTVNQIERVRITLKEAAQFARKRQLNEVEQGARTSEDVESEIAILKRLSRARDRLTDLMVERELIPRPHPRRIAATRPVQQERLSLFAEGWS